MKMTTVKVRRTRRVVRGGPAKAREQRMGRGKGRLQRLGRGKGRGTGGQRRKGRGCGRETVTGKVLSNKPHVEIISLVQLHCSCRRK